MPKRKLSKSKIADKFTYELGITMDKLFDEKLHPHASALIHKWLCAKWNPAIDAKLNIPMEWDHWKVSTVEWTPKGLGFIVILNDKSGGFRVFIKGREIASDIINQCWQDRLAHMVQSEINEIMGAEGLFDLDEFNRDEGEETVYSHEDG